MRPRTAIAPWDVNETFTVQNVTWIDQEPYLAGLRPATWELVLHPLRGRFLGVRVTDGERYCLGRYEFVDTTGLAHVPCPSEAPAVSHHQCGQCAALDEFRFAHQFHNGGYAPPALLGYMAQPHWLYIASFADGGSKVGTAADVRKRARLDEQGPFTATYVARMADGRTVRIVEDLVTAELGLGQTKRRSSKVAALVDPLPAARIQAEHDGLVDAVHGMIRCLPNLDGIQVLRKRWPRPAASSPVFDRVDLHRYPHDLTGDEHGFHVEACAGPVALVRLREDGDEWHVVDLSQLRGCRIEFGDFTSEAVADQMSLF